MATIDKVPAELAREEFEAFAEEMGIEHDVDKQGDDEDQKDFEGLRSRVESAIRKGSLTFNESHEPVFTPTTGDPITFHEPTGATLMSADKRKSSESMARLNTIMAEMTQVAPKVFALMKMRDYKVCTAITTLFLA